MVKKTNNIPRSFNDDHPKKARILIFMLVISCFTAQDAFCSTDITVRPYEIKFDYESGSTNDAITLRDSYGILITKPEWKYSPSRSNDIAYIRNQTNRKVKVKFDSNCDDMQLIINLTVTSGTGIGTLCNHVIMNYEDMQEVTLTLDGSIPSTVDERQFTWKWEVYAITNESGYCSAKSTNYSTHTFYTVLAIPKNPESEPQTNILGNACDWASGNSYENEVCEDILNNGFDDHYTWIGNCDQLSSDFVRLVTSLGINASVHKWAAKMQNIGDMYLQKTKSIDPVGEYSQRVYEFIYHQWAEAVSYQRDPTTNTSKLGTWGNYEDALYTHYRRKESLDSYVWDYNIPGQSVGCESSTHRIYSTPSLNDWRGPDR